MIKALEVLGKIKGITFIIKDQAGNIVFPTTLENLETCQYIKDLEFKQEREYYDQKTSEWYELESLTFEDDGTSYTAMIFKNIIRYKKREKELVIDETTELINKKATFEEVNKYIENALTRQEDYTLIIGDIDYFKKVNDTYGHVFGDIILKKLSETLLINTRQSESREKDIVGRIGGEEILILLKNINHEHSKEVAERLRKAVELLKLEKKKKTNIGVTMSFGMFHLDEAAMRTLELSDEVDDFRSQMFRRADKAVYESKTNGRNQVNTYEPNKKQKKLVK